MSIDLPAIGRNIAAARHRFRLTQFQLAESIGVHPNYVSQLERGRKEPSLALLDRIRDTLDLAWADIFAVAADRLADRRPAWNTREAGRRRILKATEKLESPELAALLHVMTLFARGR